MYTRKAPKESAAATPIGTKASTEHGNYTVVKRSNGTKYWKLDKLPKLKGNKLINVDELCTSILPEINILVSNKFYEILSKKPKYKSSRDANAYIFGPHFKTGYYFVGYHGNDAAQTGILDITNITKKELTNIQNSDKWFEIYMPNKKEYHSWDERKLLSKVRSEISDRVLFVGYTHGGDVGASVYIHQTGGYVDSLIIDNNYYYKRPYEFS